LASRKECSTREERKLFFRYTLCVKREQPPIIHFLLRHARDISTEIKRQREQPLFVKKNDSNRNIKERKSNH
jgi:hypothetical protein